MKAKACLKFQTEIANNSKNAETPSRELFLETLMRNIILAKNKFPELYQWTEDVDVLIVFRRFVESLESDTYSRHCHAIIWTLKELNLKNDRKTINKIFKGKE